MISKFLKIKVMGMTFLMLGSLYGVAYITDELYTKPLREQALNATLDKEFQDCFLSQLTKQKALEKKMLEGSSEYEDLASDVRKMKILSGVIYFSLLYLFSSLIVNLVQKSMMQAQSKQKAET